MVVGLYQVLAGLLFCLKQRAQLGKSPKLQRGWFPQQTPRIPLALPPQYINAATCESPFRVVRVILGTTKRTQSLILVNQVEGNE